MVFYRITDSTTWKTKYCSIARNSFECREKKKHRRTNQIGFWDVSLSIDENELDQIKISVRLVDFFFFCVKKNLLNVSVNELSSEKSFCGSSTRRWNAIEREECVFVRCVDVARTCVSTNRLFRERVSGERGERRRGGGKKRKFGRGEWWYGNGWFTRLLVLIVIYAVPLNCRPNVSARTIEVSGETSVDVQTTTTTILL